MKKLVYAINLTIDGTLDHTSGTPDEELIWYFADLMRNAGMLVYGRVTYQMMVPYWPDILKNPSGETKSDIEFATVFDSIPKAVFSQTLASIDDKNSVLYRTKVEDEILKMKKEPGKDIWTGGVALPSHLINLGLIDEYFFVVHPVIVGKGRKLLEGISLPKNLKLKLVDSKILKSGCVVLHYQK
ncbi:MAG: dihydrofolate reductase [Bacteroidetes bacterium]|nr:MAG: dihydrofolate reductase [Bacteroidota bacterium]